MTSTISKLWVGAALFSLGTGLGCGSSDSASGEFSPCGGALVSGWTFVSATLTGSNDGCTPAAGAAAIDGFIFFNPDGRYSLNANVALWKKTTNMQCGFSTADGGFYRISGNSVCIAGTKDDVDQAPCDGTVPIADARLRGAAEYCVAGTSLKLRSSTMLGLRFPAVLELRKM